MRNTGFKLPGPWWGKLIGGIIGLLRGGIIGAIFGLLVGHMIDRFLSGLGRANRTRDVFFGAVFSTLGHISKADGRVTQAEIAAAERLMTRLQLTSEERQRAVRLFRQGKEPGFDLDATLREFARHSMMRHELRVMFIELLLDSAMADGRLGPVEERVIIRSCEVLHIPANVYAAMRSRRGYSTGPGQGNRGAGRQQVPIDQSYATLGLKPDASSQEIKRAYRKLVAQYHPDKLVSRGLPDEMMEMAKTRVREINAAYDQLKTARGIR